MATRLYLARELRPPGQVVTPDAGWEKATGFLAARLEGRRSGLYGSSTTSIAAQGTSGNDTLLGQWISAPLDVNQNIGGGGATFRGQLRMAETNAALDARVQCIVYVIESDLSTVRGVLLAMSAAALSHEFNTALRNISIPLGGSTATTLVAAQAGDRIVVEIGFRQHATFAANGQMDTLDTNATELPVDETTTAADTPWVEFSDTITFAPGNANVSQAGAEVLYQPSPTARASQVGAEVMYQPSPTARASQVGVEVLYKETAIPMRATLDMSMSMTADLRIVGLGAAARAWGQILG